MLFRAARLVALGAVLAALGVGAPARAQTADGLRLTSGPADILNADAQSGLPTPAPSPTPNNIKKKAAYPPLPPLAPYPNAQRLGLRGGPPAPDGTQVPSPTVAVQPPVAPRKAAPDDDPFAPLGIDLGDIRLKPYLEEDLGYATNPGQVAGGSPSSGTSVTEAGAAFQSLWSTSDLHGQLRGGYADYFTYRAANAPYGSGDVSGRLDVSRDLAFDAQGRFSVTTETASSLGLSGVTISSGSAPLLTTGGATFGATDRFGRFSLALHASFDRTVYQDALLSNGATDNLAADNYDDYGVTLRGAYEASPEFSPFIQLAYDTWRYDQVPVVGAFNPNSNGLSASVGASLAMSHLLIGELSFGYQTRQFTGAAFAPVNAPIFAASLAWTPTPLTTVTVRANGAITDSTVAGASSALTRTVSLDLAHRLLRNFLLGANAGYTTDNYYGVTQNDSTTVFGARAEFDVNRDVVLKAQANRLIYNSSVPGSNYSADVFTLGLRVQR